MEEEKKVVIIGLNGGKRITCSSVEERSIEIKAPTPFNTPKPNNKPLSDYPWKQKKLRKKK